MDSQEIENVEFRVTRLKEGYDQNEVDRFLDRVAAYVARLEYDLETEKNQKQGVVRELAEANRLLASYGEEPTRATPAAPVSASAAKLLEAAQKTCDEVVASAQVEAARIKAEARDEATRVAIEAGQEADAKRQAAEAQAYHAEQKLDKLKEKHELLRGFLKQHLENGLEGLNNGPDLSGA